MRADPTTGERRPTGGADHGLGQRSSTTQTDLPPALTQTSRVASTPRPAPRATTPVARQPPGPCRAANLQLGADNDGRWLIGTISEITQLPGPTPLVTLAPDEHTVFSAKWEFCFEHSQQLKLRVPADQTAIITPGGLFPACNPTKIDLTPIGTTL